MTSEIGGFTIVEGTAQDDDFLTGQNDSIFFGLEGDDAFLSDLTVGENYLVGGAGNDTYLVAANTFTIVHENGNSPNDVYFDVVTEGANDALAALIDGRHLLINSTDPAGVLIIVDWELPENRIETFNLTIPSDDGPVFEQLTFEEFRDAITLSPAFLGDVAFEDLNLTDSQIADLRATIDEVDRIAEEGLPLGTRLADAQDVALIYEAGLGRQADEAGLNFWIDEVEAGLSLEGLSQEFLGSPEFLANVGDPEVLSDQELVEALYQNVLDRPGEQEGIDFWTGVLANPGFDDADLLLAFADSPENRQNSPEIATLSEVEDGVWAFA